MSAIPLTRNQVREVARRAVADYGIPSMVLMENAGRGVADVLTQLEAAGPVVICCGKGNNAGDGFVVARHLDIRGCPVRVLLWAHPMELAGDAAANFQILSKTDVTIEFFGVEFDPERLREQLNGAAWIVDALLGTGARGEPRPPLDSVIDAVNDSPALRLAVDLPSGLDCDTGQAARHTVRASHTCTFVGPKIGFSAPGAISYTGEIHVLDIGVPPRLIADVISSWPPTAD